MREGKELSRTQETSSLSSEILRQVLAVGDQTFRLTVCS